MSLQINTNVAALNAQRNLATTNQKLGSLFEQLSSGPPARAVEARSARACSRDRTRTSRVSSPTS